jgi:RNA polymerase sigma factor (sigma-70 family)
MSGDSTQELQDLITRILAGERAARRELLDRSCLRMRHLVLRIVNESFPAVRQQHEVDSIVHETWLRLLQSIQQTDPPTVADFFRLAAFKIRQVLLDMSQRMRQDVARGLIGRGEPRPGDSSITGGISQISDHASFDPGRLAHWTEFHETVQTLPEDERAVFEMHYYLDLPQVDIARILDLAPRKVSYLWMGAAMKLTNYLDRTTPSGA